MLGVVVSRLRRTEKNNFVKLMRHNCSVTKCQVGLNVHLNTLSHLYSYRPASHECWQVNWKSCAHSKTANTDHVASELFHSHGTSVDLYFQKDQQIINNEFNYVLPLTYSKCAPALIACILLSVHYSPLSAKQMTHQNELLPSHLKLCIILASLCILCWLRKKWKHCAITHCFTQWNPGLRRVLFRAHFVAMISGFLPDLGS